METLKELVEIAFAVTCAFFAAFFGFLLMVLLMAAPFIAIGTGVAIAFKIFDWII
ncbi:hypothetical protein OIU34_02445 [Pararhizobium sp. BT-229]|uniref:hypothetical protein n=1 Tax=Pararhizobium sp. BT-229 TaxID=2986923 RepID=UPI0021F77912|nr:hypothetical protein [Pararhizobium sp. BT-229]MCV9960747.1 hypothetical protein [Pararhizobium sp. BT-229]